MHFIVIAAMLVAALVGCGDENPAATGGNSTTTTSGTGGAGTGGVTGSGGNTADAAPPDASSCGIPVRDCPSGAQEICPSPYNSTAACCEGTAHPLVCSAPAGIIVIDPMCDAVCPSKVCAISPMGTRVCCNPNPPNGSSDPCKMSVP